jgi:hypothetical protein
MQNKQAKKIQQVAVPCIDVPYPVTIGIAYDWSSESKTGLSARSRYNFLTQSLKQVLDEVSTQAKKSKHAGLFPFSIRMNRMRGLHGGHLLDILDNRLKSADILVFDITGDNPNVMFELGLALGVRGLNSNRVFVFQEVYSGKEGGQIEGAPISKTPSDLSGYFLTRYYYDAISRTGKARKAPGCRLVDSQGFRAALRQRLIDSAREKQMWIDADGVEIDKEESM